MALIFNLIYFFLIIISSPWLFYRLLFKGDLYRVLSRFGYNLEPSSSSSIWLHGASAGEIISLKKLVKLIKENYPSDEVIISVCSSTGLELASKTYRDCKVIFFPFDLSFIVNYFINKLNPRLVIVAESDFWPNFIYSLNNRKIPIFVVNGKISKKSLSKIANTFLMPPLLRNIFHFCVQKDIYKNRLIKLGINSKNISTTGDMKYDLIDDSRTDENISLRRSLSLSKNNIVIIAGSIHLEEVDIFLDAITELSLDNERIRVIIAPRYPNDSKNIENKIKQFNFLPIRRTDLMKSSNKLDRANILIIDTLGELRDFYGISDIAFIGGALYYRFSDKGGHNLMEPAILGVPVIFGPHNYSFEEVGNNLIDVGAGYKVYDSNDLKAALTKLSDDDRFRLESGRMARKVILAGQGATIDNYELLEKMDLL
tara:strand:- start:13555 stop:14835 length:1281 start_codon:yes stop_codon:yes gene_type:complete